jgi:hypothetical protein
LRTSAAGQHDSTATTASWCSAQTARSGSFLVRRNDLPRFPGQTVVAGCLAAFALIASGFSRQAAPPSPTSIAVRGDVQIGRYLVQRDGTLDGAIRAFGRPTSLRRGRYRDCVAVWRHIGLRIAFLATAISTRLSRRYGKPGRGSQGVRPATRPPPCKYGLARRRVGGTLLTKGSRVLALDHHHRHCCVSRPWLLWPGTLL